jgi:hypothetical protein
MSELRVESSLKAELLCQNVSFVKDSALLRFFRLVHDDCLVKHG